jgi:hypothetical protein
MHIFDSIRRTVLLAGIAQVLCWSATGCQRSPTADSPHSESRLEIKPLSGMNDVLDIPFDDNLVGVFRCNLTAHELNSVELKIVAVKDHKQLDLGRISIPTLEKQLQGTFYIAFLSPGGSEGTITRMLSFGISTESARRYAGIKDFHIAPTLAFSSGVQPLRDSSVEAGKETLIWGVCYKTSEKESRHKTVQELIENKKPFDSIDPENVIESAKMMDDAVVVFATASGTK